MNGYVCFYNQKRIEVPAATLLEAIYVAKHVFKPPNSKAHMVTCMLAEKNGEPVVHTPDF